MWAIQQKLFKIYVILIFFSGMIQIIFPEQLVGFISDVILMIMLFNLFLISDKVYGRVYWLFIALCFLLLLSCIYSYFNGNELGAVLLSARNFKYFLLCFIVLSIDVNSFNFVRKVILLLLSLSIPIAVYQFNTADYTNPAWWDEVGGALGRVGQSGTLSLLILIFVAFEYFKRIRDGVKLFDWYLLLLIPMFINEAKLVILLIPLVFFYMFSVMGKRYLTKFVLLLPFVIIAGFAANFIYYVNFNVSPFDAIDYEFIENYFFIDEQYASQEIDIGRGTRVVYAMDYLSSQDLSVSLFGEGIGSTFWGQYSGIEGKIASEFFYLKLHIGSRNQLYQFLLDFGYLGTTLIYSAFFYMWYTVVKAGVNRDSSLLAMIVIPIFIFSTIYQMVFETRVIVFLFAYSFLLCMCENKTKVKK